MRILQLLVLALLAMAAMADTLPLFNYFYTCASGVEDCAHFQRHSEGPVRTFDITAQPAAGYFFTSYLAAEFSGLSPISWQQITSNHRGEALGYLRVGSFQDFAAVLMGPTGEIFPVYLFALDVNENGILASNGIDGPFLRDVGLAETSGAYGDVACSAACSTPFLSRDLLTTLDYQVFGAAVAISDTNQLLVDIDAGKGILSPFAVPEPSTLLLLSTAVIALRRRRHIKRR